MASNVCASLAEAVERLEAGACARAEILAEAATSFSHAELMALLAADEQCRWAAPAALHPILNRLVAEATPAELGGSSMIDVLVRRLRISRGDAGRRIRDAAVLGPRHTITGEAVDPLWEGTAAGQADGQIGPEQLAIIRSFIAKVPSRVDRQTVEEAEHALAAIAGEHLPSEVQAAADLLLLCLNPDGEYSDKERATRRGITIGTQDVDGMSRISGWITPELRATLEAILAVWARYGACNPEVPAKTPPPDLPNLTDLTDVLTDVLADVGAGPAAPAEAAEGPAPRVDAESGVEDLLGIALATPIDPGPRATAHELADHEAAIADQSPYRDTRTHSQRTHDAFLEMGRTILTAGVLPTTRGAPTTVVITVTAQQLLDGTGHVITATGAWLPFADAIRMATPSHPVLVIFDDHTGQPLYLGRSKRLATHDQYLALFARDRGCCRPGCTIAAAHCEIHHHNEWAHQGGTDIDTMSLQCSCDHRLLSLGYTTRLRPDGRVEWTPPAHLDVGQPRVNDHFFPEHLLKDAKTQRAHHNPTEKDTG